MTNTESKVVAWQWRSPHMIAANEPPNVTGDEALIAKVNGQGWEVEGLVTHADYRALEEHRASVEFLLKIEREAHEATLQELASIKARVGELVVADLALDSLIRTSNEVDKEEYLSAIVRRDDALEDLK